MGSAQHVGPGQALWKRGLDAATPAAFCAALQARIRYVLPEDVPLALWQVALRHVAERQLQETAFRRVLQQRAAQAKAADATPASADAGARVAAYLLREWEQYQLARRLTPGGPGRRAGGWAGTPGRRSFRRSPSRELATMLPQAVRLPWRVRASVPVCVAALELVHPSWSDGAVSRAIASAGVWWIPLHVFLLVGYCLLVGVVLWPAASTGSVPGWWPRGMLAMFCIFNTAYLVLDGLIVPGVDAATAEGIWNSPWVTGLANVVGATWAAALLLCAPGWLSARTARAVHIGLAATWLAFIAGAAFPATTLAGRFIALTTGAALVYARGAPALPFALLVFAAVLRQHVGPEAALAMVFVAAAIALRERSDPAAASPP